MPATCSLISCAHHTRPSPPRYTRPHLANQLRRTVAPFSAVPALPRRFGPGLGHETGRTAQVPVCLEVPRRHSWPGPSKRGRNCDRAFGNRHRRAEPGTRLNLRLKRAAFISCGIIRAAGRRGLCAVRWFQARRVGDADVRAMARTNPVSSRAIAVATFGLAFPRATNRRKRDVRRRWPSTRSRRFGVASASCQ